MVSTEKPIAKEVTPAAAAASFPFNLTEPVDWEAGRYVKEVLDRDSKEEWARIYPMRWASEDVVKQMKLKRHVWIGGDRLNGKTSLLGSFLFHRRLKGTPFPYPMKCHFADIEIQVSEEKWSYLSLWEEAVTSAGEDWWHMRKYTVADAEPSLFILTFSHDLKTFDELVGHFQEFKNVKNGKIPILLVKTKIDDPTPTLSQTEIDKLRAKHPEIVGYFECSAHTGIGVDALFVKAIEILDSQPEAGKCTTM